MTENTPGALVNVNLDPLINNVVGENGQARVVGLPLNNLTNALPNMASYSTEEVRQLLQHQMQRHMHFPQNITSAVTMATSEDAQHEHNHSVAENSIILNMDDVDASQSGQNGNQRNGNQATENGGSEGNGNQSFASLPYDRDYVNWSLKQSFPFLIVLLLKVAYSLRLGILILLGLAGTFLHANFTLTRHITLQEQKRYANRESLPRLIWIVVFLLCNVFFIYYAFYEEKLHYSLIFMIPNFEHIDLGTLLWIVGLTDFAVKFISMAMKGFIAMLPPCLGPAVTNRGLYYMMIQAFSNSYRSLIPIVPWSCFLIDNFRGGIWFSVFLLIAYLILKTNMLKTEYYIFKAYFRSFLTSVSYGTTPMKEEMLKAGDSCAICQDEFRSPIKLKCQHIFCEECVSMWFDRERTCPVCRAKIADTPRWRDGSTPWFVQFY